MRKYVAVWMDHKEARVFQLHLARIEETTVTAPLAARHKHPRGADGKRKHAEDAKRFFGEVARALQGTAEVLVVGPSTAKFEFVRYVHKHAHGLEPRIVGIETVDHPTYAQVVAYANRYFKLDENQSAA